MSETTKELKDVQEKPAAPEAAPRRVFVPRTDILETDEAIVLTADMPGARERDVEVTLEGDVLTLYGRVQPAGAGRRLVHAEYDLGDYRRVFTLREDVDRDRIEATVKNGVLRLVLPKAESAKVKRIAVKAG